MNTPEASSAPVPLLYILNTGHGGSTLLEMLLHSLGPCWSVGEIEALPQLLEGKAERCSCGASTDACPFWQAQRPLLEAVQAEPVGTDYFRPHGRPKVLRWAHLPGLLAGMVTRKQKIDRTTYATANARLLASVQKAASQERGEAIRWLVDSSKTPYRLGWLVGSPAFNVRAIHLVRDPRAYVYSLVEKRETPRGKGRAFIRALMRWLMLNGLFVLHGRLRLGRANYRLLRYEDLAASPEAVLADLCHWLELETSLPNLQEFREIPSHAVAGNQMRQEQNGIRCDDRWQAAMTPWRRRVTWLICAPLAWVLGYR